MNNTPTLSRRNTLAAFASAAVFPIAGSAAQAAPVTMHQVDWRTLHTELLAAYRALTAACDAYEEVGDNLPPCLPLGTPARVLSPNRWLPGCAWDWHCSVFKLMRDPNQVETYFDGIAQEARAAALEHQWQAEDLEEFLAQGERHRAAALATLRESSPELHAEQCAALADVREACGATCTRAMAIEDVVRELPPHSLEAVQVKLVMMRRKIDDEDYGWAAKYLDEMLSGLSAVTGLWETGAA